MNKIISKDDGTFRTRIEVAINIAYEAIKDESVFGTYRLPDGGWQTIMLFDNIFEAWNKLTFHAQGRGILISDNGKILEENDGNKQK